MSKFFKVIPGYEDYLVSENGEVFSIKRRKYLKSRKDKYGYLQVILYRNKKRKYFLIHRLVAMTHLNNLDNLPQINHKNGIKTDNRVENLEWVSASQNIQHAWKLGLKENARAAARQNCKRAHEANIRHLDENLKELFDDLFINKLKIKDICNKYNLKPAYVSHIKNKRRLQTALKEYEKSNLFQAWDIYFNNSK